MIDAIAASSSIIFLREGLEAILILSILWAISRKANLNWASRSIKLGAATAVSLSVLLGAILFALAIEFEGLGEYLFEGAMSLTAAAVVTYVVLWMTKNAPHLRSMIEEKVTLASSLGDYWAVFSVAFFVVMREGVEAVLILAALMSINSASTLLGIFLGSIALGIIGVMIFVLGIKLPLKTFFRATAIFLIIVAAGLIGYGIHELLEAAEFLGYEVGLLGAKAWDISWLLSEESGLGLFLKGLIGYDANPELLRVIVTSSYLGLAGLYLYRYMFREIK